MDRMQAPSRNALLGLMSDLASGTVGYMKDPRRTQQMQALGQTIESTRIPSLLESLSYGDSPFEGSGMTMRPNADVRGLLELAAAASPAGRPAAAAVNRGAMALGRAGERVAERVVPQVMERGGLPAEMLGAMAQGTQSPATVFHGTPHLFNKFDASKIGTGEGAQAFGHGLYLAEAKDVAKGYQEATSKDKFLTSQGFFDPSELEHLNIKATVRKGDLDKAIELAKKYSEPDEDYPEAAAKAARDLAKLQSVKLSGGIKENKGYLYQVDLPDEQIARMIDWDKPISQQPENIRQFVLDKGRPLLQTFQDLKINPTTRDAYKTIMDMPGSSLVHSLEDQLAIQRLGSKNAAIFSRSTTGEKAKRAQEASEFLRQAGIPGIRYLDEGSRANFRVQNTVKGKPYGEPVSFMTERQAQEYAKEQAAKGFGTQTLPGTSNFVVFPGMEDMLRIEQINNQPVESLFRSLGR